MFDQEERDILKAVEDGALYSPIDAEKEIQLARQAARNTLNKTKSITLRLNMNDLAAIKQKARETGIPYQTLMSSVIHQYADGKLKVTI